MTKPSNLRDAAEVAVTEADQSAAEAWLNANNGEWIDALNLAEAFARHRAAVEAENERLRGALGNLINAYTANVDTYRLGGFYTDPETENEVIEARAALGEKQ